MINTSYIRNETYLLSKIMVQIFIKLPTRTTNHKHSLLESRDPNSTLQLQHTHTHTHTNKIL